MGLPHGTITPIPDNNPDAVPALWNTRYDEIDENFNSLDERTTGVEAEVADARGEDPSLGALLQRIQDDIEGLDPDMQNALLANLTLANSNAGLALREIEKTLRQRFQSGRVVIQNRGVIAGCAVSKSTSAGRNVSMTAGKLFRGGCIIPVPEQVNGASVPPNTTATTQYCWAYLVTTESGEWDLQTTLLGEAVPDDGVALSRVSVPAGNNESNDPYLDACTLSDQRRFEPEFPAMLASAPTVFIELPYLMADDDYQVDFEITEFEGSGFELGYCYVGSRAKNGFTIYYNGTADALDVRWTARKLDQ